MADQMGWGIVEEEWRKGPWTAEEDRLLIEYVKLHGEGRWNCVARLAGTLNSSPPKHTAPPISSSSPYALMIISNPPGLKRNGKSCRLRWVNYLRPDLKRGQITPYEENIILELHARWGNRWSTIARSLPGRTDNEIKNYWRTHFKKKEKILPDNNARSKAQIMRRQQFQQQQKNQADMNRIMSSLFDGRENGEPYVPQVKQDMATLYPNTAEEQDFLYSMLNSYASVPEASNEDGLWDGLWNLDDVHGNLSAVCATSKAGLHTFAAPFC